MHLSSPDANHFSTFHHFHRRGVFNMSMSDASTGSTVMSEGSLVQSSSEDNEEDLRRALTLARKKKQEQVMALKAAQVALASATEALQSARQSLLLLSSKKVSKYYQRISSLLPYFYELRCYQCIISLYNFNVKLPKSPLDKDLSLSSSHRTASSTSQTISSSQATKSTKSKAAKAKAAKVNKSKEIQTRIKLTQLLWIESSIDAKDKDNNESANETTRKPKNYQDKKADDSKDGDDKYMPADNEKMVKNTSLKPKIVQGSKKQDQIHNKEVTGDEFKQIFRKLGKQFGHEVKKIGVCNFLFCFILIFYFHIVFLCFVLFCYVWLIQKLRGQLMVLENSQDHYYKELLDEVFDKYKEDNESLSPLYVNQIRRSVLQSFGRENIEIIVLNISKSCNIEIITDIVKLISNYTIWCYQDIDNNGINEIEKAYSSPLSYLDIYYDAFKACCTEQSNMLTGIRSNKPNISSGTECSQHDMLLMLN